MQKFGRENFEEADKWRRYCKKTLEYCDGIHTVIVVNPNEYFSFQDEEALYKSEREVMKFDLYKLRMSDLVIVNFNDKHSLGTMSEIAIAYDRRIPIIGLNASKEKLHPWQNLMCERIFDNIDEMLDYIEDFYLK